MGLGLLLVPALAGYLVQIRMNVFRYDTLRESGHHVFFRSALTGGILAILAHALVYFFGPRYPTTMAFLVRVFDFEYSATAISSLLLSVIIIFAGNIFYGREKAAMSSARKHGELMAVALAEAMHSTDPVEIMMENRQIYFGTILEIKPGIGRDVDFTVIPILKGYRDETTDEHILSQDYTPILSQDGSMSKLLKTTLSTSRVISIRLFHEFPNMDIGTLPIDWSEPKVGATVDSTRNDL